MDDKGINNNDSNNKDNKDNNSNDNTNDMLDPRTLNLLSGFETLNLKFRDLKL